MNTKAFISKDLHISLRYDKNWQPPPPGPHYSYATMGRFEGTGGFFEVSCAAESENQAYLIVKYPRYRIIKDIEHGHGVMATFDYFCLSADKNHIMEIAKTIKFIQ